MSATPSKAETGDPGPQPRGLRRRWPFLLTLLLAVLPLYGGALNRFFAGDQIHYFHELHNDFRLGTTLRFVDYSAARRYAKGDQLLYRPLTGVLLAVETSLFGYRYRAWNAVLLGLHLAVCILLFEVLRSLGPPRFAGIFALLFSVLTANFELVAWNHLSGYLLGYALFLTSLLALLRLTRPAPQDRRRWLILYALSALGAACCHEIAVVGAAGTAAYLLWKNRRERLGLSKSEIAVLLAPLALYGLLYAAHVARCDRWLWTDSSRSAKPPVALQIVQCLRLWSQRTLDPWSASYFSAPCFRLTWSRYSLVGGIWRAIPLAALGAGLLCSLRRGLTRERLRDFGGFCGLLAAILLAYVAMLSIGRGYAPRIPYYCYFFSLISTILVFSTVDFDRVGRIPATVALVLLLGLTSAQAAGTWGEARRLSARDAAAASHFDALERFVQAHRGEAGFTFAVRVPADLNPTWDHYDGFPDHPADSRKTVTEMLYSAYYDASLLETGADPSRHRYVLGPAASSPN